MRRREFIAACLGAGPLGLQQSSRAIWTTQNGSGRVEPDWTIERPTTGSVILIIRGPSMPEADLTLDLGCYAGAIAIPVPGVSGTSGAGPPIGRERPLIRLWSSAIWGVEDWYSFAKALGNPTRD